MRVLLQAGRPQLTTTWLFIFEVGRESPTTSGAPTTREEPNYKTCSQRPSSLSVKVITEVTPTHRTLPKPHRREDIHDVAPLTTNLSS